MMTRKNLKILTLFLGMMHAHPFVYSESTRFSGVDLWLPKSYQHLYLKLLDAADAAQSDEYCKKLVSGYLLEKKSTNKHPIFEFRCKTQDKKAIKLEVDGLSLAVKNTYMEKVKLMEQQEKERKEQLLKEKQKEFWPLCYESIKQRLSYFEGVDIVSSIPPNMDTSNQEKTAFSLSFNAISQAKKPLNYTIRCLVNNEDSSLKLKIKPRKNDRQ